MISLQVPSRSSSNVSSKEITSSEISKEVEEVISPDSEQSYTVNKLTEIFCKKHHRGVALDGTSGEDRQRGQQACTKSAPW